MAVGGADHPSHVQDVHMAERFSYNKFGNLVVGVLSSLVSLVHYSSGKVYSQWNTTIPSIKIFKYQYLSIKIYCVYRQG